MEPPCALGDSSKLEDSMHSNNPGEVSVTLK